MGKRGREARVRASRAVILVVKTRHRVARVDLAERPGAFASSFETTITGVPRS